jgi:hypothetical protein
MQSLELVGNKRVTNTKHLLAAEENGLAVEIP